MAKGDWSRKVQNWFNGRHGTDELSTCIVFICLILVIIDLFVQVGWLSLIALVLLIYATWRMCSKNLEARYNENHSFLKALGPLRPWVQNPKAAYAETKAYKHVKCPACGQRVRVPRGKGKIRVTCPKCNNKFEIKS